MEGLVLLSEEACLKTQEVVLVSLIRSLLQSEVCWLQKTLSLSFRTFACNRREDGEALLT